MLIQIDIRDLATIEELHLVFSHGNTMITGETGAGKSVFIEAIELALGGRASANLIRAGKEKAEISLSFDIAHFPHVIAHLKSVDLFQDSSECIIRRVITTDGRSKSYVNGTPQTLQFVKQLGEWLFHLHGQHDQQVLLKAETQRDILDRYGDLLSLAEAVFLTAKNWQHLAQQIQAIQKAQHERDLRLEYLNFQLSEFNTLQLKENEWEEIETAHRRLAHTETLLQQLQSALTRLTQGEETLIRQLNEIRKILEATQSIEPKSKEWCVIIQSAIIQLDELASDLTNYIDNTEIDPEKCQALEKRMGDIFSLARKYKTTPDQLHATEAELSAEYQTLAAANDQLQLLEQEKNKLSEHYQQLASQLSSKRQKAAEKLEKEITQTIRSLSLPYGEFKIQLEQETTDFNLHGQEKIHFLIKTNPDQVLQPLAKVISGGELSRLSLAAHLALANRTSIPTLVFDEVDTGLSGATAEKIGRLLRKLGESYQVFCITHQPQVAACGHHHLLVEKFFIDQTTHTRLRLLSPEERPDEIARMLGGEKVTEKTLAHAREVLEAAG